MPRSNWNRNTKNKNRNQPNHSANHLKKLGYGNGSNLGYWFNFQQMAQRQGASLWNDDFFPRFKQESIFELFNFEKTYWSEFFIFVDETTGKPHPQMEFAKPYIIDAFYRGQGVGVILNPVTQDALVYQLTMMWLNPYYQVTRANGLIFAYPMDFQSSEGIERYKNNLTNDMCALELSAPYGESWFWGLEPYAERLYQSINARDINLQNSKRVKAVSTQNGSVNEIKEQQRIHIGGIPMVAIAGDLDQLVDIGLQNDQKAIWEDHESMWKKYCRMRGIRMNMDQKGDRNVAGEIGNNDTTFIIIEGRKQRILQSLCNKINKISGTKLKVVSILDLRAYEENKIEANKKELEEKAIAKFGNKVKEYDLSPNKLNKNINKK